MAGAVIPLVAMFFLYTKSVVYLMDRFRILSNMFYFIPVREIYPIMIVVALVLGVGIGFFGSFFTIRRELRV